jgi:hypothetical protein
MHPVSRTRAPRPRASASASRPRGSAVAAVCVLCLAMAGAGHAVQRDRFTMESATRACTGASSAYTANLRARPLGLYNESAATVFVSCGWEGMRDADRTMDVASVGIRNYGTAPAQVTCTFVHGYGARDAGEVDAPDYYTVSSLVVPGMLYALNLTPEGMTTPLTLPQASCTLPPGVALHTVGTLYREEVGD